MIGREVFAADWTWIEGRFERDVRVAVDEVGRIAAVGALDLPPTKRLEGCALLPGFVNAHSHAFQRGLRGRGERFPEGTGSFWGWREAMYGLVHELDPERLGELSQQAFEEMLAAGMTSVGEFHYLHHDDPEARDFALDAVVLAAAKRAGIRLVLLAAYYNAGGFGPEGTRQAIGPGQRRFHTPDPASFWAAQDRLLERMDARTQSLGVVVHSLRAASAAELTSIHAEARERGLVLHIHLEEQRREVEECLRSTGKTPMAVLLEALDAASGGGLENVCAVHCTHTAPEDMARFLDAGGRVCLTPTTEASLGDGVPDLGAVLGHTGTLSLGTDSNTRISMFEEMRWLEYAQRLVREERGVVQRAPDGWVARELFGAATTGGAAALGLAAGEIQAGLWGDFVALDLSHPVLAGIDAEHLLDAVALAADDRVVRSCFVGGRAVPHDSDVPLG